MLRDDAAALDFGFLPPAGAASGLHLSTVDSPQYVPGSLQRLREFADSCSDTAAGEHAGPPISSATPEEFSPINRNAEIPHSGVDGEAGPAIVRAPISASGDVRGSCRGPLMRDGCSSAHSGEAERLRLRLAAFPTTAAQDAEILAASGAALGDTERLIIAFRMRRKLALAEAIRAASRAANAESTVNTLV